MQCSIIQLERNQTPIHATTQMNSEDMLSAETGTKGQMLCDTT